MSAKIIRCELPDGVHRFKPFTVEDYRDLLLIRSDLINHDIDKKQKIIDDLLEDYFMELPKSWRPYAFVKVYTSSIGKTKIPLIYECPKCKKTIRMYLNLEQDPLVHPTIQIKDIKIQFHIPDILDNSIEELVLNNIYSVEQNNEVYLWKDIPLEIQKQVLSLLEYDQFEKIVSQMNPIFFRLNIRCGCNKPQEIIYQSLINLFETIIHPDEIITFYQIMHMMVKNKYSVQDIMSLMPVERSFILSVIEKESKK